MSQLQDMVGSDLRRLMSDEPQDNIDEIRRMVKGRLVTDSINGIPLSPKDRRGDLFSNDMNKKISKVRPKYAARLVGPCIVRRGVWRDGRNFCDNSGLSV